ncbi:MAG: hypothetical protein IJ877_07650 [Candidatus Gastranaerophilales bacterium]|nr:hypothetical protein [Candidatus Gastranaerophilales bacterium]
MISKINHIGHGMPVLHSSNKMPNYKQISYPCDEVVFSYNQKPKTFLEKHHIVKEANDFLNANYSADYAESDENISRLDNSFDTYFGLKNLSVLYFDRRFNANSLPANFHFLYSSKRGFDENPFYNSDFPVGMVEDLPSDTARLYNFENGYIVNGVLDEDLTPRSFNEVSILEPEKAQSGAFKFSYLLNASMFIVNPRIISNDDSIKILSADSMLLKRYNAEGETECYEQYFLPSIQFNADNSFVKITAQRMLQTALNGNKSYYKNYSVFQDKSHNKNELSDLKFDITKGGAKSFKTDWNKNSQNRIENYSFASKLAK